MSLRGRVVRRQNVSCYLKPQSIQEQREQYKYLSGIFGGSQGEALSFDDFNTWKSAIPQNDRFVRVQSIYPSWTGSGSAVALRLPVGKVSLLDIWILNIGGTAVPTGWEHGFVFKLNDGSTSASWTGFNWSGEILSQYTLCRVTITSSPEMALATTVIGPAYQYKDSLWTIGGKKVVECYYVHPFFDIAVQTNSQQTEVISIQPKVY